MDLTYVPMARGLSKSALNGFVETVPHGAQDDDG